MNPAKRATEFARSLTATSGSVYSFILSLLPRRADTDEVFQEVCRLVWERFDEFQPGTDFTAWACRVAHFEVLDVRKRERRAPALFSDLLED